MRGLGWTRLSANADSFVPKLRHPGERQRHSILPSQDRPGPRYSVSKTPPLWAPLKAIDRQLPKAPHRRYSRRPAEGSPTTTIFALFRADGHEPTTGHVCVQKNFLIHVSLIIGSRWHRIRGAIQSNKNSALAASASSSLRTSFGGRVWPAETD